MIRFSMSLGPSDFSNWTWRLSLFGGNAGALPLLTGEKDIGAGVSATGWGAAPPPAEGSGMEAGALCTVGVLLEAVEAGFR